MAEQGKQVTAMESSRAMQRQARALSPFEEMDRLMERMLEGFFPRSFIRPFAAYSDLAAESRIPKVDVVDRDDEVMVRAELPGVQKQDVEVSISDAAVTIRAATEQEQQEEQGDYYRRELFRGTFTRTVALPSQVDGDNAKANFKDGVLELTLPKAERAKAKRVKIE